MDDPASLAGQPAAKPVALATLLALAMSAATLTVPTVSVLATSIITDLGISRTQLGALVVAASSVAAVISPAAGKLCDWFGGKRMLLAVHMVACVALTLLALAPHYLLLILATAVGGLATGTGNQAANKVLAAALPPGRRGATMGVKQSGVQLSVLVAGLLLPLTASLVGWRWAAVSMVTIPLLGSTLAWRVLDPAPPVKAPRRITSPLPYRHDSGVRWVTLYAVCMGVGTSTTLTFIALYAQEGVGLTAINAGVVVSVLGASGALMRIAWGALGERSQSYTSPMLVLALLSMAACATIWSAASLGAPALFVGALLAGSSIMAWNTVANLVAIAIVDDANVGRASGLVNLGFLGGYSLGPLAFGWSVDTTGSYDVGWGGLFLSFGVAAAVAVLWGRSDRRAVEADGRSDRSHH